MAKSVDELIEFLVEEIVLNGSQGVTINDIASYVESFYGGNHQSSSGPQFDNVAQPPIALVDRRLLAKVWTWLARHPDVSIGDDRKYNEKQLSEVESEFPDFLDPKYAGVRPEDKADSDAGVTEEEPGIESPQNAGSKKNPSRSRKGPRFTVDKERVYRTICGHPPDSSKVAPLEFVLLTHIAAAGSNGILQGALGRVAGQDKRSVPKRTDALHQKGYIIKESVYTQGNKTSRLVLRKFAGSVAVPLLPAQTPAVQPQRQSTVRDVIRRVFDELSKQNLMPQADLAEQLDMLSPAKSAVLVKVLRRLDRLKFVKRVKTAFGPSASSGDVKQCIQLVQAPSMENLDVFQTDELSLDRSVADFAAALGLEEPHAPAVETAGASERELVSAHPLRLAKWNPDRLMPNVLVDATRLQGKKGLTNLDARQLTTGIFTRRTIEGLLLRISCQSLLVQPIHLRHLAVVRSHIVTDGLGQYFHHSWDSFREIAGEEHINVNQIPGAKQALKEFQSIQNLDEDISDAATLIQTDQAGFPIRSAPAFQLLHGEADFVSILQTIAAADIPPRLGEPIIVENQSGMFSLGMRDGVSQPPKPRKPRAIPQRFLAPETGSPEREEVPLGRPRKYMRGTERFWQRQFKQAKLNAGGDEDESSKTNIMKDPAGLALYANRPSGFDETLIQAIDAHLPVPAMAQDISEDWIQATKDILNRSSNGIFVTPKGLLSGSARYLSQVMIIRSNRLGEVDLIDRQQVHPFRFISTSASHSFAYHRYYPKLNSKQWQQQKAMVEGKKKGVNIPRKTKKSQPGPQKGLFYEEVQESIRHPQLLQLPVGLDHAIEGYVETTDEELEVVQNRGYTPTGRRAQLSNKTMEPPTLIEGSGAQTPSRRHRRSTISTIDSMPASTRPSRKRRQTRKVIESAEHFQAQVHISPSTTHASAFEEPTVRSTALQESQLNTAQPLPTVEMDQGHAALVPSIKEAASVVMHTQPATTTEIVEEIEEETGITAQLAGPLIHNRQDTEDDAVLAISQLMEATYEEQPTRESGVKNLIPTIPISTDIPASMHSSQVKRPRSHSPDPEDMNPEDEDRSPRKRQRRGTQKYTTGTNHFCRQIVRQLMAETVGAAPNDGFTIRRVAVPRWKEAGFEDGPPLNSIKFAIKFLCQQGKLRQTTFSFRGKGGLMLNRSVLYLSTIQSNSDIVDDVKRKMIEAEPTDYIPPEWIEEASRMPMIGEKVRSASVRTETPTTRRRRASTVSITTENTPSRRRRRASTADTMATSIPSTRRTESRTRLSTTPPLALPQSSATGFLTLNVPRLSSLPAVQVHNWRAELTTALKLSSTSPFALRRGRNAQRMASSVGTRSITWAKQKGHDLPSSLQDIFHITPYQQSVPAAESVDLNWQRFASEIEAVQAWEEENTEEAQSLRSRYAFINHSIPAALLLAAKEPRSVKFAMLVEFNEDGSEKEFPYPPTESWPLFLLALRERDVEKGALIAGRPHESPASTPELPDEVPARRSVRQPKRKAGTDNTDFDPRPKRRKVGNASTRRSRLSTNVTAGTVVNFAARGDRYLRDMSEEQVHRLAVSVVLVRTLAGGIESYIDWSLVMTVFPAVPEELTKHRWNTISNKYRHEIQGLTENLRWKYLEALENGLVVSVDFQDLRCTDWNKIVEWGVKSTDKFYLKHIDDLPARRSEFVETNKLSFAEPKRLQNSLAHSSNITGPAKEELVSSIVFGSSLPNSKDATDVGPHLQYQPAFESEISDPRLRLAKSWVFASILTPASIFDSELVQIKLSKLAATPTECEDLLLRALKVLQDEKLIQKTASNAKTTHNSNLRIWESAKKFHERFEERRMITAAMLRRAATYKFNFLDPAFERGGVVAFNKDAMSDDGHMVAVLNLMAGGLVKATAGPDIPNTRYGLDWERVGYKTREMDKSILGFSVHIVPLTQYVFGDPKQEGRNIPIPRGDTDQEMGYIPPWIDIHGRLQPGLWEMFLVGVLGLVVQTPGIDPREISRTLSFALEESDVVLLMDWCVKAGFAKMEPRSKGYQTTEYWWMCISDGSWAWNNDSNDGDQRNGAAF